METFVAHALRAEGHDASEDGTGRGTPLIPIAIQERAGSENPTAGPDGAGFRADGASYTLEARPVPQAVAFDCKGSEVQAVEDGSHPTLRSMAHETSHANAGGHAAVAFAQNTRDEVRLTGGDGQITAALAAVAGMKQQTYLAQPVAFDLRGRDQGAVPEGSHDTANIRAASGGSSRSYLAAPWAVRRLTPREYERLQGFTADYTLIPWRHGKPAADGPRYKALGNSMAVNVMEWIGARITLVDGIGEE